MPLFVRHGQGIRRPVESMPGVSQQSPDVIEQTVRQMMDLGVFQFLLFGVIESARKDPTGQVAMSPDSPVAVTLRRLRDAQLDAVLHVDLCFCEYTSHGHCGKLSDDRQELVDNDATLAMLGQQAAVLAEAGADVIAPSAMMDGQVQVVRAALDQAGLRQTAVLSYAIKYASNLYGPFREAGEGGMSFGDRKSYQMDFRRAREWKLELEQDLAQGADAVMVKPAMAYLDVLWQVRQMCALPVAAYHVSGEYAMIQAAGERGWLDADAVMLESAYAMRRAGADLIVSYGCERLAPMIR